MVIYTKWLWFGAGFTVSPRLILIQAKYKDDTPLLRHEQVHQAQMRRVGTVTFWWRYLSNKAFRQAAEVEAYQTQIACGAAIDGCARHLVSMYWLGIDFETARKLLVGK